MAIIIDRNSNIHELWVHVETLEVYRLKSYFDRPSAKLENVKTGDIIGGAIGSLNLEPFATIDQCDKEMLRRVIENVSKKEDSE